MLCTICQQPFKMKEMGVSHGINNTRRNRMKVCSALCDQSLQYCLGLAHGVILFDVLQHLCGSMRWKWGTASIVLKQMNSSGKKIYEDGHSNMMVKREPQYFEDDVTDTKVFFGPDECSENEHEFPCSCVEPFETDLPKLQTSPKVCDPSQIGGSCSLLQHYASSAHMEKKETTTKTQCHFCHARFSKEDQQVLAEHLCEVHTKEICLDVICDICSSLFQDSNELSQHKKNVHGVHVIRDGYDRINSYKCDECLQVFLTHHDLLKHEKSCHSSLKQTSRKTFLDTALFGRHTHSERKQEDSEDRKRYQCHCCNKEYPTKLRLQRHNQFVHSQQMAVDCTVCGKSFRNKVLLKHHTQFIHSKQTPANCLVCGKTYRNAHLLKMHTKVVHKVKVIGDTLHESLLQCIYCTHTFSTVADDAVTNHLAECHDKKGSPSHSLSCNTCGDEFKKKVYLTRHIKKAHGLGTVAGTRAQHKKKKESERKRHPCDKCGKTYTQSALSKHIRIYHTTHEPVDCDMCGKTFINSFHLAQHKRQHAPGKICHICGASFKTDTGLHGHLAAHKGTKSHVCEVCGAGFVRKTSWQRHVKLHSESVQLQCDCCSKTFRTVYSLNTHMLAKHHQGVFFHNRLKTLEEVGYAVDAEAISRHLSHQCVTCGENLNSGICPSHPDNFMLVFKCNFCELVVCHVDDLCQHLKQHDIPLAFTASTRNFTASWSAKRDDSDVDYTCQVCHKSFRRRENLVGHMKQHQEKAYECHVCLKKFTYKCNMKNHLRTHSDDKPFQCELCPRAFKCKQLLNNHRLVHNLSQSPFKCHICGKGLTRKFFLQRHCRQMHPGVTV
ncbi:uncharacterized protein LOC143283103 [Babylonia areolata]|uniref:uncharacterized protein LOC143283103 n=1 Tax=Babylonia areolata TaxID=304850 RepID=UPI003FCF8E39